MAYDMHVVRTKDWTVAAGAPISKDDVDTLLKSDAELTWSTTDYMDMKDDSGTVTRYYTILWNGDPCFIWYKDQIMWCWPKRRPANQTGSDSSGIGSVCCGGRRRTL